MAGRPKGTGGKAEELTKPEIRRIDKCLSGTTHELRNKALFYLGLGSGMRISEIVSLTIQDIRPHQILLNRIVLQKHSTKSNKSRTVTITQQALDSVQDYLQFRELSQILQPQDPLFPGQKDPRKPITPNGAKIVLKKMFQDAAVPNASSHSLRRTHANSLRRLATDLLIIQEQLGHSSLATTQRYFQVDPIEVQNAIDKLKF